MQKKLIRERVGPLFVREKNTLLRIFLKRFLYFQLYLDYCADGVSVRPSIIKQQISERSARSSIIKHETTARPSIINQSSTIHRRYL